MSSYDDVLHTEVSDSVLKHSMSIQISGRDKVSNVSMDENLSRAKAHNGVDGNTAIGTSEVEVARLLRTTDPLYENPSRRAS